MSQFYVPTCSGLVVLHWVDLKRLLAYREGAISPDPKSVVALLESILCGWTGGEVVSVIGAHGFFDRFASETDPYCDQFVANFPNICDPKLYCLDYQDSIVGMLCTRLPVFFFPSRQALQSLAMKPRLFHLVG